MLKIINIFLNLFNSGYFSVISKKFFKRFEKKNQLAAKNFAEYSAEYSTEDLCKLIDQNLFNELLPNISLMEKEAKKKLDKLGVALGGGGNYILLYFLIIKFKLEVVVETGVAAGWTSLFILRAFKKNGKGKLYSSDFPYFRLKNPEQYVGYLAKNEINKNEDWVLDIRGDDLALPEILLRIGNKNIDLIHYDSDKSYSSRNKAYKTLITKTNDKTIFIFDDIDNNLHFKELVLSTKKDYLVLEFKGKYLGIFGKNFIESIRSLITYCTK